MFEQAPTKLRPIVILGAGGHAVSVANVAISSGYEVACFVDTNKKNSKLLGIRIIGTISDLTKNSEFEYSIAIGDNFIRERVYKDLRKKYDNIRFPSLIHRTAVISYSSTVAEGTVVMPNVIVGPNSIVRKFCILNTQSSIDHDCEMSDFSSIGPGAITGGNVKVGNRSAVSIGAVVKHGVEIGDDSILGAAGYLNKNLENNRIAFGTPARTIRNRESGETYL